MCSLSLLLFISLLPLLCYNLKISTPPTDRTARLGSKLSFSCLFQQTPDLTQPYNIDWLFNGNILNLIPPSGLTRRSSSLDTSSLTSTLFITEIILNDSGQYSCQLSVNNGSFITSESALLEIATLAENFLTNPESKSPMVGEGPVYLFCSHGESHPPANITWLKNSQIDSSLSFITTTVTVGMNVVASSTLTISQAKPSDIGAYTCVATSSYFPDIEVRSGTALLMVGSETSAPVWLQHPHEEAVLPIYIGAELILTCTVFGNPSPIVTWERDGSVLSGSNDVTLSTGIQSSYRIAVFSESDIGSYRCGALNILDSTYSHTVELRFVLFIPVTFLRKIYSI
ncbi:Hemicentin-1-like [Oopsacas minuta]|uniref:Hemicentin-1-like n=1 Tax=Oopsacas minuta TaxID=111878 RepID=A0AAV7JVT8_9METZ|nr:Hemicentin-1-like [Oopsacas minuta]